MKFGFGSKSQEPGTAPPSRAAASANNKNNNNNNKAPKKKISMRDDSEQSVASVAPVVYTAAVEGSEEFLATEFLKGYAAQKKKEERMGSQEFMKIYE